MLIGDWPSGSDDDMEEPLRSAANDNPAPPRPKLDERILEIARALGRQIAREEIERREAANDNQSPHDATPSGGSRTS